MLGKLSTTLFPQLTSSPLKDTGPALYVVGLFVGIIEWSFGLVWFFFAIAAIHRSGKLPFNMGWWGFTFPLGVYSAATLEIGQELDTEFFRILGTVRTPWSLKPLMLIRLDLQLRGISIVDSRRNWNCQRCNDKEAVLCAMSKKFEAARR
jgi:Voltage-dependent anion channel